MKKLIIVALAFAINAHGQSTKNADSLFNIQQWKSAIPLYEAAAKSGALNALAWNRLGYCYHNVGNLNLAVENYNLALNNKPTPFLEQIVHSRLARVYSLKKEIDKSFTALDKAIVLGYSNLNELETNADFTNIRNDKRFENEKKLANENAFPCLKDPRTHEFDFWVGEWDVYARGTEQIVGKSRIDVASGGCMILENWTAVGGQPHNGKSMNFVDPVSKKWIQVWVGSSGINNTNITRFYDGEYKDGAMRFVFNREQQGQKIIGRFIFYNEGPNQVRQFSEQSSDNGKTWTTNYDFTYKRK